MSKSSSFVAIVHSGQFTVLDCIHVKYLRFCMWSISGICGLGDGSGDGHCTIYEGEGMSLLDKVCSGHSS